MTYPVCVGSRGYKRCVNEGWSIKVPPCVAGIGTEKGKTGVGTDMGEQRELLSMLTVNTAPAFGGCGPEAVMTWVEDVGDERSSAFQGSHDTDVAAKTKG